jgi:hypothetical protein
MECPTPPVSHADHGHVNGIYMGGPIASEPRNSTLVWIVKPVYCHPARLPTLCPPAVSEDIESQTFRPARREAPLLPVQEAGQYVHVVIEHIGKHSRLCHYRFASKPTSSLSRWGGYLKLPVRVFPYFSASECIRASSGAGSCGGGNPMHPCCCAVLAWEYQNIQRNARLPKR